jgi:hypothetical protein
MNTTAIYVIATLLCVAAIMLLILALRYLPYYIRKYKFYWYFGFRPEPEEEVELHRLQSRACVIPKLKSLAITLNDIYKQENQVLNNINGLDNGTVNDFEGMRGNLMDVRKDKKQAKQEFYRAKDTAEFFGFNVPKDFKDYLK